MKLLDIYREFKTEINPCFCHVLFKKKSKIRICHIFIFVTFWIHGHTWFENVHELKWCVWMSPCDRSRQLPCWTWCACMWRKLDKQRSPPVRVGTLLDVGLYDHIDYVFSRMSKARHLLVSQKQAEYLDGLGMHPLPVKTTQASFSRRGITDTACRHHVMHVYA